MLACAYVYSGMHTKKLSTMMKRIVKSWVKEGRSRQGVPWGSQGHTVVVQSLGDN